MHGTRLAVAIFVLGVTWAGATFMHQRILLRPQCSVVASDPQCRFRPSWEDPAAVLLALGGLAVAAGIVTARRS